MMGGDDVNALTEDLGHLMNSSSNVKPRFRNALDLNDFFKTRTARFEVDNDDASRFVDDDEEDGFVDEDASKYSSSARLYADTHARAKRTTLSSAFGDLSFDSFYDPEQLKNMQDEIGDGAVKKLIVKEGDGIQVPNNCKVYVHYICLAEGFSEPYDSTISRGSPHCVDLRSSDLIAGLFLAIKSMRVFEVAKFSIRYDFAFGVIGCPPRIPPSTDIYCIVEVLAIIEEDKLNSVPYMSQDERAALAFKEIFDATKHLRMDGNGMYNELNYWGAIKKYRKAANVLEEYPVICTEDENLRQDLLYTLYVNLAQCYLKVKRPQQACIACQLGLRCKDRQDASCSKIFYRFAEAKYLLGNTEDALRLCQQGLVRDPKNTSMLEQKQKILSKKKEDDQISKATYSKMGKAFVSSSNGGTAKHKPTSNQEGQSSSVSTNGAIGAEKVVNSAVSGMILKSNESASGNLAENKITISQDVRSSSSEKTSTTSSSPMSETSKGDGNLAPIDWEEYQEFLSKEGDL